MPIDTRTEADEPAAPVRARRRGRLRGALDTDGGAVTVLVLLVVLTFSPWWAGGKVFAPLDVLYELYEPWNGGDARVDVHNHFTSDAVTQYVVFRKIAERSFAEDGFVGWSDWTFGGRPEYANTMAAYDDWTMQLHRFLDFWTAWHVGLMGHFLVAALSLLGGNLQTNAFTALVPVAVWLGWILQPIRTALLIPAQAFPSLLGSPQSLDLAKVLGVDLFAVAYFGFLPTVVAYRAAFLRSVPAAARCLIAIGLLLPLTPLVGPFYHRVQLLFIFGGVWAFALYWQDDARRAVDPVLRTLAYAFVGAVGLWTLASLATVVFADELTTALEAEIGRRIAEGRAGFFGDAYPEWTLERARRLLVELRIWHPRQAAAVLGALTGLAALWLRARNGLRPASLLLLGALVVELAVFAGAWVTVVDPAEYPADPDRADIAAVRERVGRQGRVSIVRDPDSPPIFFPPNTLAMVGIATIQGYESVVTHGVWEATDSTVDAGVLGRMGVTHALSRPAERLPAGWTAEYHGDGFTLWRNERALPRYLALAASPAAVASGGERDDAVAAADDASPVRGSADPSAVVRPGSGDAAGAAAPVASRVVGPVTVRHATANRRLLEVPARAAAVRVAESWAEGWRFRVEDGPWQPVRRAADRSMLLPLGSSAEPTRVELAYRRPWRAVGGWVTFGALLGVMLGTGAMAVAGSKRMVGRPRGPVG